MYFICVCVCAYAEDTHTDRERDRPAVHLYSYSHMCAPVCLAFKHLSPHPPLAPLPRPRCHRHLQLLVVVLRLPLVVVVVVVVVVVACISFAAVICFNTLNRLNTFCTPHFIRLRRWRRRWRWRRCLHTQPGSLLLLPLSLPASSLVPPLDKRTTRCAVVFCNKFCILLAATVEVERRWPQRGHVRRGEGS